MRRASNRRRQIRRRSRMDWEEGSGIFFYLYSTYKRKNLITIAFIGAARRSWQVRCLLCHTAERRCQTAVVTSEDLTKRLNSSVANAKLKINL